MLSPETPIKQKLIKIILFTSCSVLLITSGSFLTYELLTFRQTMVEHLSTVGKMLADTSNAALKFKNQKDAAEVLSSLEAEPHIVAACLYDADGRIFTTYPEGVPVEQFPSSPGKPRHEFQNSHLISVEPVLYKGLSVGTPYLNSDMGAMYQRFRPYTGIAAVVMIGSLALAYGLSHILQRQISGPVISLAETAKAVSQRHDYSARAPSQGNNEFGLLTDAFNNMLERIHDRDVQLKAAQQTLKQHADNLEKRVEERTAKLSETVAELEAYSYSISHDMRAPLRAMQGYAVLILEKYSGVLDDEAKGYLERINRAGRRMDTLIQDILTYSRLSRLQLELKRIDLEKLVEDVIQQYPGLQGPKVKIHIRKPLAPVIGHEAALTQVVSNLLGNAVKFVASDQKPVVEIYTELRDDAVRLWIEDNGIGIAQDDLNRIFGIFEKIHPEKIYEGTGIGLSIVRKSVERMGGQSGVESVLGKGSRFWVQFAKAE